MKSRRKRRSRQKMRLPKYVALILCLLLAPAAVVVYFVSQRGVTAPAKPSVKKAARTRSARPNGSSAAHTPSADRIASTPARPSEEHPLPPPTPSAGNQPLADPPAIVKAVYFTSWSVSLRSRIDYLIDLAKTTQVNAVVIDIKDYSGAVAYPTAVPAVKRYGAERRIIRDMDAVIARLHHAGIYTIARITVFQDPLLARARPELAVHRKSLLSAGGKPSPETLWLDRKKLAWIDPASKEAWGYFAEIGRDARSRGFDELNFDYVRFPSDGDLKDMQFSAWDGKTPKRAVIDSFFSYMRQQFPDTKISADLFGLATVNHDDLGIGQRIEDGYKSFGFVCPMIYPSHFARGFLGFENPAAHPYEVVNYSMSKAFARLKQMEGREAPAADIADLTADDAKKLRTARADLVNPEDHSRVFVPARAASPRAAPPTKAHRTHLKAKLRPWLQDFNVGARYSAEMVKAQIKAVEDALGDEYAGYMMWSPSNVYTRDALK